ncbi:C4-dicarboxylate transport protein DctQ, putative [Aurantimonas manganoxydans SI85-9A1]|uniref:TRAP transporter small permease protein n=3 Tax=Aurantimonas TaxID=182269 RepID=Q1YHV1_AURMS|nr:MULTISPECIES: TRAP transporter small permease [Aurantimonas]EAS50366.1 C4-dicarboxylate transport protein DctQ, putative [Aurantimonas manganoxydans SI85-9A1]MCC4299183.1 TRAP transporter small permease [Aurantimonas coralicida]MCD1642427.1 TRAP transporter small permease [Aurantimonas coralicida]MDE0925356.1 TRAP transporter small permease [Aurantimonas coralicida]BAT27112.1 TRAP-type C4-dicarboxylate transporter, small permease [Aurantimonas coralicida]
MSAYWPFLAILALIVLLFFVERRWPDRVTRIEENILATILAAITLVSFSQVVARYGFNSGWTGALELTRILFAWMILFGMSYGLKQGIHLGVDALIRTFPKPLFRAVALFGAFCTALYAIMLLSADWLSVFGANSSGGAIFYWKRFFDIGLGLDDLRYPVFIQEAFGMQERVQRWIAYLILPIGLALLAFRALQGLVMIWNGERELIIAGHEAEDLVAENKDLLKD